MNTCVKPEWNWVWRVDKCHLGSIQLLNRCCQQPSLDFTKCSYFLQPFIFFYIPPLYTLLELAQISTEWKINFSPLMQAIVYIIQLCKAQSYGTHSLLFEYFRMKTTSTLTISRLRFMSQTKTPEPSLTLRVKGSDGNCLLPEPRDSGADQQVRGSLSPPLTTSPIPSSSLGSVSHWTAEPPATMDHTKKKGWYDVMKTK